MLANVINGRFRRPDLSIPSGTISLSAFDSRSIDSTDDVIVGQQPYVVTLDADGAFSLPDVLQNTDGYVITPSLDGITYATPGSYHFTATSNPFQIGGGTPTTPSSFFVSGKWANLNGTPAAGEVWLTPTDMRFNNNGNVIMQETIKVPLDVNGAIVILLVQAAHGYDVIEKITGTSNTILHIAGVSNVSLSGGTPITTPSAPTSVAASLDATSGEMTVIWTPPSSTGGTDVTDYLVSVSENVTTPAYAQSQTISDLNIATFEGIVPDVNYAITVKAHHGGGYGPTTTIGLIGPIGGTATGGSDGSGTSGGTPAPAAPTNLHINSANEAVYVTWQRPPTGSAPTSYTVTCTGQTTKTVVATASLWQKCVFFGLTIGNSYTVTVASVNTGGTSSTITSTVANAITRPDTLTSAGDMLAGVQGYGYDPFSLPTYVGGSTLSGTLIIEGYQLIAPITIAAGANITLNACRIAGSNSTNSNMITNTAGGTLTARFCEFDGTTGPIGYDADLQSSNGVSVGVRGASYTILNSYFHNVGCAVQTIGNNATVKYCYVTNPVAPALTAAIPLRTDSGNTINYTGNLLRSAWSAYPTPVVDCYAASTTITNITIKNNWIDGGSWGLQLGHDGSGTLSNVILQNNRWLRGTKTNAGKVLGGASYSINATLSPSCPSSGTIYAGSDRNGWQTINYSGISGGTLFTGCSGGTGVLNPTASAWNSAHTYSPGDVATQVINGITYFYCCIHSSINNQPSTSPNAWTAAYGGAIRVGDLRAPTTGGIWFNGGWSSATLISGTITGSYTHSGNVWDDDGSAIAGL